MRGVAIWAVLGLVSACATADDVSFRFEGDDDSLTEALAAAAEWKAVCGVDIPISRDSGRMPMTQVAAPIEGRPITDGAVTDRDGDDHATGIRFTKRGELRPMLAHELGHALGIGHTATGIMRATPSSDAREWAVQASDCP